MKVNLNNKNYNVEIDEVSETTFLGIIINENLSGEDRTTLIKN